MDQFCVGETIFDFSRFNFALTAGLARHAQLILFFNDSMDQWRNGSIR
jgi:hypothetical protein